ncbi:sensor histidine kinase [Clostridium oryzae]|uniref:histidine kinase n=1 Tax=Clostridium oryzae TaxID=1450648 RepID=A0A1V4IVE0_9CLOT|nr:HAMP domain-containing sensor histidine kinase [Clostridium oryzae]OPJ64002.1 alkaline phosphatase synthesis sensor protein PhoR [Clostridium oryzae]
MKKSKYNALPHLYSMFLILFLVFAFISSAIVIYLMNSSVGKSSSDVTWSSYPISFTNNFSKNISFVNGKPQLSISGKDELKKHKLFIQIVDRYGYVVTNYNSPIGMKTHYSPIEIVQIYKNGVKSKKYSTFVGSVDNRGYKWTYIIGFPVKVLKLTFYLDYGKAATFKFIVAGMLLTTLFFITVFGVKTNRILSGMTAGIEGLKTNSYAPMREKGLYREVYASLNALDEKLKANKIERERDEKLREEWIANISHDLKTPLSPIKGYSEMLIDPEYEADTEEVNKYAAIIHKNAKNIESIVENLNFTYQLKNNMLPINRKDGNLVRLMKEIIIDVLNHSEYEDRNIVFDCSEDKINFCFDSTLLRRAFDNLIYNAVLHNEADTAIKISMIKSDKIYVIIKDNGRGIAKEDLKKLFERYYRGTSTAVNVKGSGLGMAIAKQIIEAHDGKIYVTSKINSGTTIKIEFPE